MPAQLTRRVRGIIKDKEASSCKWKSWPNKENRDQKKKNTPPNTRAKEIQEEDEDDYELRTIWSATLKGIIKASLKIGLLHGRKGKGK